MNVPHSSTTAVFWDACKAGQLKLQHCQDCGKPFYYPRTACPACGGTRLEWRQMKGTGTIYSYSHVHLALGGYKSWEAEVPFTLVQIELDEGPRMLSRLAGKAEEGVKIGDRVTVAFTEREGETLPYFRRTG
jgi:uncharacterized OB-fold protein